MLLRDRGCVRGEELVERHACGRGTMSPRLTAYAHAHAEKPNRSHALDAGYALRRSSAGSRPSRTGGRSLPSIG